MIDKVCDAIDPCVVLVVSGRPQVLTDQLAKIDALVASWLPGSEVTAWRTSSSARKPHAGRLSMTWPRTEAQVPINVGDAVYQPLFPFGWGLRTPTPRAPGSPQPAPRSARATGSGSPGGAGSARPRPRCRELGQRRAQARGAVAPLGAAVAALDEAARPTPRPREEAIVSVARDVAQTRVTAGKADADWARLIANADHALLTGDADAALTLLTQVVA